MAMFQSRSTARGSHSAGVAIWQRRPVSILGSFQQIVAVVRVSVVAFVAIVRSLRTIFTLIRVREWSDVDRYGTDRPADDEPREPVDHRRQVQVPTAADHNTVVSPTQADSGRAPQTDGP